MRLLLLAAAFFLAFSWIPSDRGQAEEQAPAPIHIEADRMESSRAKNVVVFSGNVKANQDQLTINADQMTVLYAKVEAQDTSDMTGSDLSRSIDKITARGNIKIIQGDWVAAGDTMEFNGEDRIVTLAGNATAWQNQNMVSGDRIVLYLDEGKSIVESSSGDGERVKAFIYPESEKNTDSNRP